MSNRSKKIKSFLSLLLCTALIAGCSASGDKKVSTDAVVMEKEESVAVSCSFIGGKDVMPIGGYIGPYVHSYSSDGNVFPEYITDEYYEKIADSGINLIVHSFTDYASVPEAIVKNLELCEKYGIGFFVTDNNVLGKMEQDEITAEEVAAEIVNYSDYESFCGLYMVDEPQATYYNMGDGTRLLQKYEKLAEVVHNELDILTYCNAFPINDLSKYKENYEKYIDDFCEILQPKVLMWDYYPFDEYRKGDMKVYFYNMNLIREHAVERGIPFWAYVQAGSQWNDSFEELPSVKPYYPNEYQFNWNVNTCLAFGAQGIQYFPLMQPYQFTLAENGGWDFERNGILGAMGNKNQWYFYAQNINKHIGAIDEVLMNSVSKGIIVSGEQAKEDVGATSCVIQEGTFNQLQSITGDAMVGCFNHNGKTALYVVNYSMENAQKIKLNFAGSQNLRVIQNAETSYKKGSAITLDMAAGEGVLLVLE